MQNFIRELKEFGIELLISDIEKNGYYIPSHNLIVVSSSLDEQEMTEVILHEMKHALSHKDYIALYKSSFCHRSKMENEANDYMINQMISENGGIYNYTSLIERYNLGIGYDENLKRLQI